MPERVRSLAEDRRIPVWGGLLLWLILCGLPTTVQAQEKAQPAQVTYIAGQNVYLDVGRDHGVVPGDTVTVYRDGAAVGRLVVVSGIADRSVLRFAGDPFPITVGTLFEVRVMHEPGNAPVSRGVPPEEAPSVSPPVASSGVQETREPLPDGDVGVRSRRRSRPRVTGRVQLGLNALQSTTSWSTGTAGETQRTFLTPSLNLHATVRDLPGGTRMRTRLRSEYRYTSPRVIDPQRSVRVYEMVVDKTFAGVLLQAGRFSNRYADYDGYWDGALIHYGGSHAGLGTAFGFLPDRSNEGFSSDMPRYSGFAHFDLGGASGFSYAANASFNAIHPTNDLLTHRFVGLSHRGGWNGLTIRHDMQLDRDPESGRWVASRFQVRGTVAPHRHLRVYGRYALRQPYSIYRTEQVISYRREKFAGGVWVQLGGVMVSGDVTLNYTNDVTGRRVQDGQTVGGGVQVPRSGILGLGFTAMGSYWRDDNGYSTYLNAGVTRALGRARARFNYQIYRTETFGNPLDTHSFMLQAVVPIGRRFYSSTQVRLQRSTTLGSAALYTSVWYTF